MSEGIYDLFDGTRIVEVHDEQLTLDTLLDGQPVATFLDEPFVIDKLKAATTSIPGRPGWRLDRQGREWYSAAWL